MLLCDVPVLPAQSWTARKGHLCACIVKSGGETVSPNSLGICSFLWFWYRLNKRANCTKRTQFPMMHCAVCTAPPNPYTEEDFLKRVFFLLRLRRQFGDAWWSAAELHHFSWKHTILRVKSAFFLSLSQCLMNFKLLKDTKYFITKTG